MVRLPISSRQQINLICISFLFLFACFAGPSHASYNCEDLIGSWSNERFDKTLNKERRTIATLNADGGFWVRFIYSSEDNLSEKENQGTWACDGTNLTISINSLNAYGPAHTHVYEVLTLNHISYKLRTRDTNCGQVYGDCGREIIYEYFRVIN